jgi:hypothetical protein
MLPDFLLVFSGIFPEDIHNHPKASMRRLNDYTPAVKK